MKRSFSKVTIGEGIVRHRTRIESDMCEMGTHEARIIQNRLLQDILNNPSVVACGPSAFDKMSISHNGSCWVVETEAVVSDSTGASNVKKV